MAKKVFRVTGTFVATHHEQNFSKEVLAADAPAAKEHMLSLIGSKHGVPRRLIKIQSAEEVAPDRVEDPVVRHAAGMKA